MKMRPCAPLTLILAHLSYFHYGRNTLQNIILAFYSCSFATSVLLLDIHILANVKSQTHHSSLKLFISDGENVNSMSFCPKPKIGFLSLIDKRCTMYMFKSVRSSKKISKSVR